MTREATNQGSKLREENDWYRRHLSIWRPQLPVVSLEGSAFSSCDARCAASPAQSTRPAADLATAPALLHSALAVQSLPLLFKELGPDGQTEPNCPEPPSH